MREITKDNLIVVTVSGGMVQNVRLPRDKDLYVAVLDYDCEGVESQYTVLDTTDSPCMFSLYDGKSENERLQEGHLVDVLSMEQQGEVE